MKPLVRVSATDIPALTRSLAAALEGGPAVWPVPATSDPTSRSGGAFPPPSDATRRALGGKVPRERGELASEVDDRIALVVESSGSTDAPKRVVLSADALIAGAEATADALGSPGQWLLALPGHYIAGAQVLVRGLLAGTETIALEGERFDASAFAAASARLDSRRPRYTSLVPVQLARLVEAAARDPFVAAALTSYDAVLVGGQALAPALRDAAAELGAHLVTTYGSTETAGGCVYDGRPLDGVMVRIVEASADKDGSGLVELSGPLLADGYLGDPARTAAAFAIDPDGTRWYRTGDLGDLAADGTLRIRGRADDVIISGGVKVTLGEVERAIRGIAGFEEAVVVPVADAEWGERTAVVVERARAAASAGFETTDAAASAALVRLAAATDAAGLPPAARPVRVEFVERMPLLASGKPDRRAIGVRLRAPRED